MHLGVILEIGTSSELSGLNSHWHADRKAYPPHEGCKNGVPALLMTLQLAVFERPDVTT